MAAEAFFTRRWYGRAGLLWLLLPLKLLASVLVRWKIRRRQLNRYSPVPIIVVGNITVGGTGKTPLTIALIDYLRSLGLKPGVISRGYGGSGPFPKVLDEHCSAVDVGDEPLLIYQRCAVPVAVAPKRVEALRALLESYDCDVVLSDDGLQHYAMSRSIEIAVLDGERGLGNGQLLPVGPLREPASRLQTVDLIVGNGRMPCLPSDIELEQKAFVMDLQAGQLQPLQTTIEHAATQAATQEAPAMPKQGDSVLAVAGIGNPQRFFNTLAETGMQLDARPFPDHYQFSESDFDSGEQRPVVMTEKDAVKCRGIAINNAWYLPVSAELPGAFYTRLHNLLMSTPLALKLTDEQSV